MGIFNKKPGGDAPQKDDSGYETLTKGGFSSVQEMLELYGALSFEKQFLLSDVIGSNDWQFDMGTGTISFGPELSFPVQIIGSLSFANYSWMWGWANTQSGIPDNLLVHSNQIRTLGEEKGMTELTEGMLNVSEGFEHTMGMIACGLFDAKAYYCANYGQGTLVLTIDSDKVPAVDMERVEKIATNFPQFIQAVEVDHRKAFVNYLIDRGFAIKMGENSIEGMRNGKTYQAEFDELGRLTNLKASI